MIPIRDETPNRRIPWITLSLLLVNAAVFVYQAYLSSQPFDYYLPRYAFIPSRKLGNNPIVFPVTLITSMFMHGGISHLVGNMWFLWVFGRKLEDVLSRTNYLSFYLLVGCTATLTHMTMMPNSNLPLVGASGAIAGVLGAYFLLFPFRKILTLLPLFFFFTTVRIPSVLFLGIWFLIQLVYAQMGISYVAWWAHVGGFVSGVFTIYFFRR